MKKSVFTAKKMLAMLLCVLMALSCFAISGIYAADHVHSYGKWVTVTPATCETEGLKTKTCVYDDCGTVITMAIPVDADAHVVDESAWVETAEAKCDAEGEMTNTCTLCGETVTKKIEKIPHTLDESKWEITKSIVHGQGKKTENGYRINFCSVCNEKVTETIEVEHSFDEAQWKMSAEATCSTEGVEINTCIECGDIISRATPVISSNHTFSTAPEVVVAPTCQSAGSGFNRCTECGEILEVEIPIDYDNLQHTFNYEDSDIEACRYANYYCTTCETYLQPDTEHPHTVAEDAWDILANSSCTVKGTKKGTCSVCNETFTVRIPLDETAHTYSGWTVLINPTCVREGLRVRVCVNNYGHKQYEVMNKLDHKYKTDWEVVTPATCSAEGLEKNLCVSCNEYIERAIPVNESAHNLTGEWTRVSDPTCHTEGLEEAPCSLCGTAQRAIPKHNDTYVLYSTTNANCTYEGEATYVCTECSTTKTEAIPVNPDNHAYVVKTSATCREDGLEVCRHDSTHTRVIPADPDAHTYPVDWTYPTDCSQGGEKTKTCTGCGNTISEAYTPGHTVGDWTYVIGNCTSGGTMAKHCTRCGLLIEARDVEAGEHAYKILEKVAPTCTERGYDKAVCTYCDGEFQINIVRAKGHYLMITTPGKAPTCTEDGYTDAVRCVECSYVKVTQDIIPATGHNFVLQSNGTHSCTNCYQHLVDGTEDEPVTCDCICHNQDGLAKFFFKILKIFYKLFGTNKNCDCGVLHYDDTSIFEDIFATPDIDLGDVNIGDIFGDIDLGELLG